MTARKRFAGQAAIVTGAARGIGRAIATYMAREGAALALWDREETVQAVAEDLLDSGSTASAWVVDVGQDEAVRRALDETVATLGGLSILVNNAGIVCPSPIEAVDETDWDRAVRVNLKGAFFCAKHCFAQMKSRGSGKIVNISSRASLGKQQRTVYSACKAGLIGMTRTWALEMAPYNVTVNTVAPGPVATRLFTDANPPDSPQTQAILNSVPLGRMGTPEDVAHAVAFLASDEAAFITGQTLFVCGGLTVGSVYY